MTAVRCFLLKRFPFRTLGTFSTTKTTQTIQLNQSSLAMEASSKITGSSEYRTLSSFAKGENTDLKQTIQQFTTQTRDAAKSSSEDDLAESLSSAWNTILAVAGNTPHGEQDKLVEFIRDLRKESVKSNSGDVVKHENGAIWGDLPTFGWQVREAWNFTPKDPQVKEASKPRWINQNAYVARLTSASEVFDAKDPLNFSLYAVWTIREALEDDAPEETPGQGALRAAAMWILYANDKLWKLTVKGEDFEGRLAAPGRKYRDETWRGFSKGRWVAWKNELQKAQHGCDDKDTAELLGESLEAMRRVEKS